MIIFFEEVIRLDSLVVSEADHEQKLWEIAPRKKIKWNWDFQRLKRTNPFLGREIFYFDLQSRVHVTSVAEILETQGAQTTSRLLWIIHCWSKAYDNAKLSYTILLIDSEFDCCAGPIFTGPHLKNRNSIYDGSSLSQKKLSFSKKKIHLWSPTEKKRTLCVVRIKLCTPTWHDVSFQSKVIVLRKG